jgi:hypothetical protein
VVCRSQGTALWELRCGRSIMLLKRCSGDLRSLRAKPQHNEVLQQYGTVYRMRCSQEVFRVRRGQRKGQAGEALRVMNERPLDREFLARLPAHSGIALEASVNYGWLVDEMERSGHHPKLCNPLEAKRRMGSRTTPRTWTPEFPRTYPGCCRWLVGDRRFRRRVFRKFSDAARSG